jgi:hypothetical protein
MFAGLFQSSLFMRISPAQVTDLTKQHPTICSLEPMPGRPMKQYFVIPEALYRQEEAVKAVAVEAAAYVGALAPKTPKPRKPKAANGARPKQADKKATSSQKPVQKPVVKKRSR